MVRIEPEGWRARFDATTRESITHALEILRRNEFFEFIVSENNRLLAESFDQDSEEALAARIREHRQTNRILMSLVDLAGTLNGGNDSE